VDEQQRALHDARATSAETAASYQPQRCVTDARSWPPVDGVSGGYQQNISTAPIHVERAAIRHKTRKYGRLVSGLL